MGGVSALRHVHAYEMAPEMSDDTPPILRAPKVTTNMTFSRKVWTWLKAEAADRATREGGQPSMSAVLEDLVRERMDT